MNKKILSCMVLFASLLFASIGAQAQGLGMVREFYACNFLENSDMDDLMAARDYMLEHLEMGNMAIVPTFLWTPLKTNNELDFLWFNQYESFEQFGVLTDEYLNSPHGQMIQARFDSIVECVSGLVTHDQIFNGGDLDTSSPPVLVVSSACQLKQGHSLAELGATVNRLTELIGGLGSHQASTGFMQIPLVSSSGMDVYFFAVFQDLAAWTTAEAAVAGVPQVASIGAEFQSLTRCNTSLWLGENIVAGN